MFFVKLRKPLAAALTAAMVLSTVSGTKVFADAVDAEYNETQFVEESDIADGAETSGNAEDSNISADSMEEVSDSQGDVSDNEESAISEEDAAPEEDSSVSSESVSDSDESESESKNNEEEDTQIEEDVPMAESETSSDNSFNVIGFNQKYTTYTLTLKGISLKTGESVSIAVWSADNGQDDLRWNAPSAVTSDSATVKIKLSDYKSAGKYYVHFYKVKTNNKKVFLNGTEFTVETVRSAKMNFVTDSEQDNGTATICISDIDSPAGVSKVQIPTWSKSDQSDIKWYTAVKNKEDGNYYTTFSIADHNYNLAEYTSHLYITDKNGFRTHVGSIQKDFSFKTEDFKTSVSENGSKINASFRTLSSWPAWAEKIVAAVWSKKNGQDDLTWTDMIYDENAGDCSVEIPISKLKHLGEYYVHVYVKAKDNSMHFICSVTGNLSPSFSEASLVDANAGVEGKEQTSYTGTLKGLHVPCGVSKVQAAVWSVQDNQDDLKWYTLKKRSDGSYTFTLPISNHKGTGQYYCHYYAITKGGDYEFITACNNVVIDGIGGSAAVTAEDGSSAGTFKIRIEGLTSPSGISSVTVPVWTEANNQKDIKWYTAQATSDGAWEVTAKIGNHSNHTGLYNIHVYATTGNGQFVYCCKTQYTCTIPENTITFSGSKTATQRKVTLYNPTAKNVRFAVWSAKGSQDDLIWVTAKNNGSGTWSATLTSYSFLHNGTFYIHAYTDNTFLAGISAEWTGEVNQTAAYASKILDEVGWNLKAAFNWSVNLPYELGAGYPESVPSGQLHSVYYANYGFTNKTGHCYVMAATFVYMARLLGYEAYFVEGAVPYRNGGLGPHGWAELVIDGTTYVFDPDFQYNTGRNGYQITYGASGTWKYVNYSRVS